MKITFLGSGSAFTLDNYQSNMLIDTDGGKRMLFDCGGDIRFSLKEKGLTALDIDAIYISHAHADHIGGLEYIAFITYFVKTMKGAPKPILFCQEQLMEDLWNHSLKGGLNTIQSIDCDIHTFFDVRPVPTNGFFIFDGIKYKLVQTIHVVADRSFVKSFGLMFETNNRKKVFITADTQYAPYQIRSFIEQADVVFHDCELAPSKSGVHAHYEDLKTLPPELKKKLWLYHYNDGELPDAKKDGFQGFVSKGQEFDQKYI